MKTDDLLKLIRSKKTIFTFKDISLIWEKTDTNFVKKKIYRYVKSGKLFSLRRGIYSIYKDYDKYELATRIYTPSYISFETVLGSAGITFQFYSQIFVATYLRRDIECDLQKYSFHRLKEEILTNLSGLEKHMHYYIASPERAFLDVVYLHKDYHFDNLTPLDWDKVYKILPIYRKNKRMAKTIKLYHKQLKKS